MKKYIFQRWSAVVCLLAGLTLFTVSGLQVFAAEVVATVEGTVLSGTTASLLKLATKDGNMEIKLDSTTDANECKVLLPEQKIQVSLSYGNDGYMHAVKISNNKKSSSVTLDQSTATTVKGKLGSKTRSDLLYLKTAQGEMQIKLDDDTSMSGVSVLIIGEEYSVTCARGSDAYMHAVSIADASSTDAGSSSGPGSASAYLTVTGKVDDDTKTELLYLKTKDGEMQFKIDSGADTSRGLMMMPDREVKVSFYHGTDGYLHAVKIEGDKSSSGAEVYSSSPVTVKGTVSGKSTENMLYLHTDQGTMEIKLDKISSISNSKILIRGQEVSVSCANGSDAYLHALSITA